MIARRAAIALLALLAVAPAAPAAAVTPEVAARVIAAVRDSGCTMDEAAADGVFGPMGIDRAATAEVVEVLEAAGLAAVSADGAVLTLSPGLCAAGPGGDAAAWAAAAALDTRDEAGDAGRAARFIAAVRANGCAMTEAEAMTELAAMGFTADETVSYVEVLVAAGLATLSDDFQQFALAAPLCAADPAADAAAYAEARAAFAAARPAPGPPDPATLLAAVRDEFGPGAVAEMAAFQASMADCTLDAGDPAALAEGLVTAMTEHVAMVFAVDLPLPAAVTAELAAAVAAFLADPGPDFVAEGDRLVLQDCTP